MPNMGEEEALEGNDISKTIEIIRWTYRRQSVINGAVFGWIYLKRHERNGQLDGKCDK